MKQLRPYQKKIVDDILRKLKESDEPILIDASVGSGKSLILSSVLLVLERARFDALCLTLNSTLIQQNAETYKLQQGHCGINCSALNSKASEDLIIFASPNSICQDIRSKKEISNKKFRLIIIDEAHNLCIHNESSMYVRILKHYSMLAQENQYSLKIIGLTGTCYRGKGIPIYGENEFFKSKLCSISTSWLIENGYLTKPIFGIPDTESFDFSQLRVKNTGKFDQKQLASIVDANERLTGEIMREVTRVVEAGHTGAFIFASTRKHCLECIKSLPEGQAAIITGETPHDERKKIIELAKLGVIRYLVNVNVLTVGIDIPSFDVCAWLRPTESLVLYTQGIGRVLRLHPGKLSAIILDFAGNLDRHGDIDDPLINEALQPRPENEKDFVIRCYTCNTLNVVTARRCVGVHNNKRCTHYFNFKACHVCQTQNDITSRYCRSCDAELIDPNAKLYKPDIVHISRGEYWITAQKGGFPIINCRYYAADSHLNFTEMYFTNTDKSRNVCYAKFVRTHIDKPSDWYMKLHDYKQMQLMLEKGVKTPHSIIAVLNNDGTYKLIKKLFN